MGRHSCTSSDPPGHNGVIGRGNPVAGSEQIGHVVAVMQHRQARLGIRLKCITFEQPVHYSPNVLNSMDVSTWDIPEDRQESTWQRLLLLDTLAEPPLSSIEGNQLWIPYPNHRLIGNLRDSGTAGEYQSPLLATGYASCLSKEGSKHAW